jgi:TusE/DsrC/DsvC family sulfur relay protein
MTLEVDNKIIQTDDQGFIVDPDLWDQGVAIAIANREGLTLTDDHWKVISFMRDYYEQHHIAADARFVIKHLKQMGFNGSGREQLYKLFPYGYVQQACKVAGMRRPRAWSVG